MLNARDVIAYMAIKEKGNWDSIYKDIMAKPDYDENEVLETLNAYVGDFITILDKEYPETLKQAYKPPFVLFYKGDINLIKNVDSNLLISGTRKPTAVGKAMAEKVLDKKLDKNIIIGSTKGLNAMAMTAGNKTIGVVAHGLDYTYDKGIVNCDLLLSEYPNGVEPSNEQFMFRTRIMVGLSDKVLLLESEKFSGAVNLITNFALNCGKDILVVPTNPTDTDTLNNELIREGAIPVLDSSELQYELEAGK